MSGLIANGTFSNQDVVINSDPFFPSVSSNHIREVLRLDSSVTNQRLISAIEAAVIHVNEQLESLLSKAPTLEEITTKQVNGKSIAAVLYFRAISAAAGAELCERYRSYDTTNNGSQKAEELTPTIDDYKRDLRFAIRDLKKVRRLNVELV
ncbi:head completion/stabilization protein [Acinetobacter baumannii]|uniref:Phage-related capsid completion protein n=1 Tax=Acinetobacter baumannii TaxID=470 RepID=A0A335FU08_ACIBA|nr:head completion/stabilization protein [Acinetobacter baumannii]ATU55181.1 capsid protein [Acinetobacter baumannii]EGK46055.1 putative phage-related capsid completion protein [Acinetobacter baumannii AB210]EHU2405346.1 head completion/stabilization protein [Acinetobacter baumannii]EKT8286614.1 head completion/stabilization protein [Acinetobacter baumannii]EKW1997614.1 head completion/stabilization protein [Acinetobacter baumannii]